MKISDEVLMKHFNVEPEQIEYDYHSQETRVYFPQLTYKGIPNKGELVIEFSNHNVEVYITMPSKPGHSTDKVKGYLGTYNSYGDSTKEERIDDLIAFAVHILIDFTSQLDNLLTGTTYAAKQEFSNVTETSDK